MPLEVVILKVGLGPEVASIPSTLVTMQEIVGGHIEQVKLKFLPEGVVAYVNEDGHSRGLPLNRWGLLGTILLVRIQGQHEMSLLPSDITRIRQLTTKDTN
jgi:Domain of unknown function (DUF3846)